MIAVGCTVFDFGAGLVLGFVAFGCVFRPAIVPPTPRIPRPQVARRRETAYAPARWLSQACRTQGTNAHRCRLRTNGHLRGGR